MQRKKYAVIGAVLCVLLLVLAFVPLERAKKDASDWMAALDDSRSIASLTIPGTHDSGALYSIADVAGKCQSLSIKEQLKAGVRFIDIRLQLRGDKLAVVHSFVDQMTDFADVLVDLVDFLHNHPTEFLIVSIKQDADAVNTKITFADAVETLLAQYPDTVSEDRALPQTVADARGKMYILSRYADARIGVPANAGWQDNASFSLDALYVQDHYAINDADEKLRDIAQAIDIAAEQSHALVLNYTSCYLTHGFPPLYAATPAKPIHAWLEEELAAGKNPTGVIICDFMTSTLSGMIWRCNFR